MACVTNYTIQCVDVTTGDIGCFLFDIPHWRKTGEFKAISPVFACLTQFFLWDNENGMSRKDIYITRDNEK